MKADRIARNLIAAGLITGALCSLPATRLAAQAPAAGAAQQTKLAERSRLSDQARQLRTAGKTADAIAAGEEVLAIERELLPPPNETLAASLDWLGHAELDRENFLQAEKRFSESLDIRTAVFGADHWKVTGARLQLEQARQLAKLSPRDRQDLRDAEQARQKVVRQYHAGHYKAAIESADKCRAVQLRVFGAAHPVYVESLNNLGLLYQNLGDYARAESFYRQALEIDKRTLSEVHPEYATHLNNLAELYRNMGDHARAEPLYRQAMEIDQQALGEGHPDYATRLNNLALLYADMGDNARAEPLYRQAMEIRRQALGEAHPDYAASLNNLAVLCENIGDYARAEPLHRQAMEIRKKALGEAHPDYAASLNNLALLYRTMGAYARAEPLYRQAIEIHKQRLGEKHPGYATSLNNLADLYDKMGDYRRAEPLYLQALEIRKNALGEVHPDYALSLNNLAGLYYTRAEYARAESLYRRATEIRRQALGEAHPDYAQGLNNLALLYQRMGYYTRAEPLFRQAAEITLENRQQSFFGESERQQLAHAVNSRFMLDSYLALETQHGTEGDRVYPLWLEWKGLVLRQQWRQHALADRPELKSTFAELEHVTARLARLALAAPTPEKRQVTNRQLAELSSRKEQLERALARRSAAYTAASHALTVAELQRALPADAALVDFVEYSQRVEPKKAGAKPGWTRQLAAFVVCRAGPIRLVNLGDSRLVSEAIDHWRGKTDGDFGRSTAAQAAGILLRERVWRPVEALLGGSAAIKLVLVSPDGPLGRLPFNALPGKQPGRYLLEDWLLVVIPSPAALTQRPLEPKTPPKGNLLVVADVDYNALPSAGASASEPPLSNDFARFDTALARDASQDSWPPLDGTRGELTMLQQLYRDKKLEPQRIKTLARAEATTAALCRSAARYRYLHLATHGFFASPKFQSALEQQLGPSSNASDPLVTRQSISGYHPGLLSGLVLAGANHPQPHGDTGYLTAEEVGTLDLRGVELAVLSACETGLGNVAGGEGLLGLQRAFQAAGARTVVASLWKVPDQATRLLMERFYKNLWQSAPGQPPMTKLEALREAQLWMLRAGAREAGITRGARGLAIEETSPTASERLPPYFWAAFVLSGDWR